MRKTFSFLIVLLCFFIFACTDNLLPNIASKEINYKDLIVRYKPEVNITEIKKLELREGIESDILSAELKIFRIKINNGNYQNFKKNYLQSGLINYIEENTNYSLPDFKVHSTQQNFSIKTNGLVPNDPFYNLQWNMKTIDADKAWEKTNGNKNLIVAVIDSGVDPEHPDLKENLLPLIDILDSVGESDIYSDSKITIDFKGKDGNGHGTHVSGIIAASFNNATGVAGLAGNVKILPIKAATLIGVTSAAILTKSITTALDNGARVINMSIGGNREAATQSLIDAVNLAIQKGVLIVAATGNESDRSNGVIKQIGAPAIYSGVLSVSALTSLDKVANYSNGGPEVEISAPGGSGRQGEGERIYSTWPTYNTYRFYKSGVSGSYAYLSGTSMACPHVTGTVALLWSIYPNLTAQQIRVRILSTTSDVNSKGFDNSTGYGKLNTNKALILDSHDKK